MKFKFIGDPAHDGEGPRTISVFGIEFPPGEAVEVEDEAIAAKLAGNSHFEEVKGKAKAEPKPADVNVGNQG